MLIRVSPQWQVTIPRAFRRHIGPSRLIEARIEHAALMLRPIMVETVEEAARMFGPDGVTQEVLVEALRVIERRRAKAAAAEAASSVPGL